MSSLPLGGFLITFDAEHEKKVMISSYPYANCIFLLEKLSIIEMADIDFKLSVYSSIELACLYPAANTVIQWDPW